MKLIYRGKLKKEAMPLADLPENAVMFKEPKSERSMLIISSLISVPAGMIIAIFVIIKGISVVEFLTSLHPIGILLALICIIPHEYLHAICFPKDSIVNLYASFSMFCVQCTDPISKMRFIFMSALPNLVFGFLPMIIWLFMPNGSLSDIVLSFGSMGILTGVGDYMNIFNAATQMPKGTIQQLSGFNSYWYYPDDKTV